MRIVIDLQGAQTESRFRGIGRYSLSLARAVARNRGDRDVLVVLNGLFPETIAPIRDAFDGLLPRDRLRVWFAPGPVRDSDSRNGWRREVAERVRESFIASLKPDAVLVTSLFEGYLDDAVTSIGVFDRSAPTVSVLYDLIPLLNPSEYLDGDPLYRDFYLRKIESLKRSAGWLGISRFATEEGRQALSLPGDATFDISTACGPEFARVDVSPAQEAELRARFGIPRRFVMYSGGADKRKNLQRLIRGYSQLSPDLRATHQLVLAGKIAAGELAQLKSVAAKAGLAEGEVVATGYVTDDELRALYNLCELFVFPSWHEGFGLPALEAMSCGAPVIGANAASIPEVIARPDALFDPYSEAAICEKIQQVLTSKTQREELAEWGLVQCRQFSWDLTASRALGAIERIVAQHVAERVDRAEGRPRLAYVSPLPPERTGIADYSSGLLPALARHYEIDVVVAQPVVDDEWVRGNCPIRTPQWLIDNADRYDRVLYHFGNSPFHRHMFDLIDRVPGAVVLHDFFLSSFSRYMERVEGVEGYWTRELYRSHGYRAVLDRFRSDDEEAIVARYPCNFGALESAEGVIVHSEYARNLAVDCYGVEIELDWAVVPLPRGTAVPATRTGLRSRFGIPDSGFVVASFGIVAPTKRTLELLRAWLKSDLSEREDGYLVFVGENDGGAYGARLLDEARKSRAADRIRVTGWVSGEDFHDWLRSVDVAVQLRASSRGETSAAALDCMSHGIPTIVNANGSMAELDATAVVMLDDDFSESDLVKALEALLKHPATRSEIGERAQEVIRTRHAPDACAELYRAAIEKFYRHGAAKRARLIREITRLPGAPSGDAAFKALASAIAVDLPDRKPARTLYLDVTATASTKLRTGIERVARSFVEELVKDPPAGYRVEPVLLAKGAGGWRYRFARGFTLDLIGCPADWADDEIIEPRSGDLLVGLDMSGSALVEAAREGVYRHLRNLGVELNFLVFDLLPMKCPQHFPQGASEGFEDWLDALCRISDRLVCISRAVADELSEWVAGRNLAREAPPEVRWIHLGADFHAPARDGGLSSSEDEALAATSRMPTLLMVGTIEPRKGHLQVLAAFEHLWSAGVDLGLLIVGAEGWRHLPDEQRRTIPAIASKLRSHPESGKRLFWLEGASDACLERAYASAQALIAASEGEGFGLPLIEAAQRGLPIIARDLPVFREVAGEHAYYFTGEMGEGLAEAIRRWLQLRACNMHPVPAGMLWLSWRESARSLIAELVEEPFGGRRICKERGSVSGA